MCASTATLPASASRADERFASSPSILTAGGTASEVRSCARHRPEGSAQIVAAEAGNYFTPGVAASDATTIEFFVKRGYRATATTQNLIATKLPIAMPEGVLRATEAERERVLKFIENEFGRIWRFETARAFENDPPTLFYIEIDRAIAGFAAHDANNRGLGFFGPTGVARAQRGRGIGARLLHASLADLRRLGYDRAAIPWTDAVDFYRKSCGARVEHQFVTLALL